MHPRDQWIVDALRFRAAAGVTFAEIFAELQEKLGDRRDNMLSIVSCLHGAFGIPIPEMVMLQASELMGGSAFSAEKMETLLLPQIQAAIRNDSR